MADVSIAAISSSLSRCQRMLVPVSASTVYASYIDNSSNYSYKKSADALATWGSAVSIKASDATISAAGWYDKWTSGDAGTLIHHAYFGGTSDDVLYRSLDTSSDTLGTESVVFAGLTAVADSGAHVSITKARGGNLYVAFDIDNGAETGFYRSTDGGVNWTVRANPIEAADDTCMLFPANAADANDIWALYQDASTNELTIKTYDDSANTWSESAAKAMTENVTDGTGQFGYAGSVRHSDGNLIVAYMSTYDSATNFNVFRWDGSTITDLTAIQTGTDDLYYPGVCIDQNTDHIYVSYIGKRDGSEQLAAAVGAYYVKSTDNGSTWSAGNTAYSQSVVFYLWNSTPLQGPLFAVAWRGSDMVTNAVNAVDISGGGAVAVAYPPFVHSQAVHRAAFH